MAPAAAVALLLSSTALPPCSRKEQPRTVGLSAEPVATAA